MRALKLVLGAAMMVALVVPVLGQNQPPANSFFTAVNPREIKTVKIDTTKAMKTMNVNKAFHAPSQRKAFSLTNIFPRLHLTPSAPIVANAPVLPQKNNPFQPNPIRGKNPFDFSKKK